MRNVYRLSLGHVAVISCLMTLVSACSSRQKSVDDAIAEAAAAQKEKELEEVVIQQTEEEKKQAEEEKTYSLKDNPNEITDDNPLPQLSTTAGGIYQDATELFLKESYSEASRLYERAGQEIPDFYAAYFNAGVSSELAGDTDRAGEMYRKALELKPYHAQTLVNLYKLYRNTGKIQDANELIEKGLREMNDRAGPHVAAATRARLDDKVDETEREARTAMRYDERQVEAMRLMGWVFAQRGQFETSKFALDNALVLEPGNALLHLDLAFVYLKLEEEDKALSSFETAVRLNPNLGEAQEYYALLILKKGDREKAMKAMERAIKLRGESAWAQLHYGNVLRANGRYDEALTAYAKAESMDPSISEVHFNRGVLYLDNEVVDMPLLDRLNASRGEFTKFREKQELSAELLARLDDYESAVDKKIKREERRLKREAQRALDEAAEEKEALSEDGEDGAEEEADEDDWGDEGGEADGAGADKEDSGETTDKKDTAEEDDWDEDEESDTADTVQDPAESESAKASDDKEEPETKSDTSDAESKAADAEEDEGWGDEEEAGDGEAQPENPPEPAPEQEEDEDW